MGRITVFSGNDVHSKRVLSALGERKIPHNNISIVLHQRKLGEIHALSAQYSLPQVFFNSRFIGGAEETIKELKEWDKSNATFSSPLQRYHETVGKLLDPIQKVFDVPHAAPKIEGKKLYTRIDVLPISLPDATMTSVLDITEKLKNSLPLSNVKKNKIIYKNCVSGAAVVREFKTVLDLSEHQAAAFAQHLLNKKILVHCTKDDAFYASEEELYRLQCNERPDILNSYRVWSESSRSTTFVSVLDRIDSFLNKIEMDCVDGNGLLDHLAARNHSSFALFEDSLCEFQSVGLQGLKRSQKLALGLNVYRMMMKYGFIKVGIPRSEGARKSFIKIVKFDVEGRQHTFDDWFDRMLGSNNVEVKSKKERSASATRRDPRIILAMNAESHMGSTTSLPFHNFDSENMTLQLDLVARIFFADDSNLLVNVLSRQIISSKVLKWYRADFGESDRDLVESILPYLEGDKKVNVATLLRLGSFKLSFFELNYTRNAVNYMDYNEDNVKSEVKVVRALLRRFAPPTKALNETLRLETLHKLEILDTLPEERFDRITRMVKVTFQVPIVLISLVDEDRQWFKSNQWTCTTADQVSETGRDISFCGHAILGSSNEVMWIEDARNEDRFVDNPLVTGPLGIRFYAGCPLSMPAANGEMVNIGTLCVIGQKPRLIDERYVIKLKAHASQVEHELMKLGKGACKSARSNREYVGQLGKSPVLHIR